MIHNIIFLRLLSSNTKNLSESQKEEDASQNC